MPERQLRRQGKVMSVVLALTVISVGTMGVIAVVGLPRIFSSANNSEQVARGNDLASCRSSYNTAVTDARADADDVVLLSLQLLGNGDRAGFQRLATDPPGAALSKIGAVRQRQTDANAEYVTRVLQSRTDPTAFLRACRRRFG